MIAPSRIIDFRRSSFSSLKNEKLVSFEWTAPGNDFVFGKAARYMIQCFATTEEMTFDTILPQPDVYGTRQSVTVQIPITNQPVLCTIYAFDEVLIALFFQIFLKASMFSLK